MTIKEEILASLSEQETMMETVKRIIQIRNDRLGNFGNTPKRWVERAWVASAFIWGNEDPAENGSNGAISIQEIRAAEHLMKLIRLNAYTTTSYVPNPAGPDKDVILLDDMPYGQKRPKSEYI